MGVYWRDKHGVALPHIVQDAMDCTAPHPGTRALAAFPGRDESAMDRWWRFWQAVRNHPTSLSDADRGGLARWEHPVGMVIHTGGQRVNDIRGGARIGSTHAANVSTACHEFALMVGRTVHGVIRCRPVR